MQLVARLRTAFGAELPVTAIFDHPTGDTSQGPPVPAAAAVHFRFPVPCNARVVSVVMVKFAPDDPQFPRLPSKEELVSDSRFRGMIATGQAVIVASAPVLHRKQNRPNGIERETTVLTLPAAPSRTGRTRGLGARRGRRAGPRPPCPAPPSTAPV
jgi:hypothetical protein